MESARTLNLRAHTKRIGPGVYRLSKELRCYEQDLKRSELLNIYPSPR